MQITRRNALTGATAAVAVAAIPATTRAVNGPTKIERLYAEQRRAEAIALEVVNTNEPALEAATALLPERPLWVRKLEKETDAAWGRAWKIQTALLNTPAETIRDVHLKVLSDFAEGHWRGVLTEDDIRGPTALAVMRDLERLAGEVRS